MVKNFKKTKNATTPKTLSNNNKTLELRIQRKAKTLNVNIYNLSLSSSLKNIFLVILISFFVNLFSWYMKLISLKLVISINVVSVLILVNYVMGLIKEESLVIIKDLGLQITTKYMIGFSTKFIPNEQIQTFFINEVIYRQKIVYVLTLLLQENLNQKLLPLFFNIKPRLSNLEVIYRNIKELDTEK